MLTAFQCLFSGTNGDEPPRNISIRSEPEEIKVRMNLELTTSQAGRMPGSQAQAGKKLLSSMDDTCSCSAASFLDQTQSW